MLTTWLLDCASARELGLTTTGHARARHRPRRPRPRPTNLYLASRHALAAAS